MRYFCLLVFIGALGFAAGCDDDKKETETKTADATVDCGKAQEEALSADQSTPVGTPTELTAWLKGEQRMPVKLWNYEVGDESTTVAETTLVVNIEAATDDAKFVTYPSNKKACADRLFIPGMLSFNTMDGIFREQFSVSIYRTVDAPEQATIESVIPLDQIHGQYNFSPMYEKYNEPTLYFTATALPKLSNGTLSVSHKYRTDASSTIAQFGY